MNYTLPTPDAQVRKLAWPGTFDAPALPTPEQARKIFRPARDEISEVKDAVDQLHCRQAQREALDTSRRLKVAVTLVATVLLPIIIAFVAALITVSQ